MADYRTIVVPYDFSDHSRAALDAARDLARRLGSELHLLHVVYTPAYVYPYPAYLGVEATPPPIDLAEILRSVTKSLDEVAAELEPSIGKVGSHVVQGGSIADSICDYAESLRADLIAMGTHGRTGLAHVFLGSVAERTLRKAPCPVLTVRAPD
jgi:universal stress protein A